MEFSHFVTEYDRYLANPAIFPLIYLSSYPVTADRFYQRMCLLADLTAPGGIEELRQEVENSPKSARSDSRLLHFNAETKQIEVTQQPYIKTTLSNLDTSFPIRTGISSHAIVDGYKWATDSIGARIGSRINLVRQRMYAEREYYKTGAGLRLYPVITRSISRNFKSIKSIKCKDIPANKPFSIQLPTHALYEPVDEENAKTIIADFEDFVVRISENARDEVAKAEKRGMFNRSPKKRRRNASPNRRKRKSRTKKKKSGRSPKRRDDFGAKISKSSGEGTYPIRAASEDADDAESLAEPAPGEVAKFVSGLHLPEGMAIEEALEQGLFELPPHEREAMRKKLTAALEKNRPGVLQALQAAKGVCIIQGCQKPKRQPGSFSQLVSEFNREPDALSGFKPIIQGALPPSVKLCDAHSLEEALAAQQLDDAQTDVANSPLVHGLVSSMARRNYYRQKITEALLDANRPQELNDNLYIISRLWANIVYRDVVLEDQTSPDKQRTEEFLHQPANDRKPAINLDLDLEDGVADTWPTTELLEDPFWDNYEMPGLVIQGMIVRDLFVFPSLDKKTLHIQVNLSGSAPYIVPHRRLFISLPLDTPKTLGQVVNTFMDKEVRGLERGARRTGIWRIEGRSASNRIDLQEEDRGSIEAVVATAVNMAILYNSMSSTGGRVFSRSDLSNALPPSADDPPSKTHKSLFTFPVLDWFMPLLDNVKGDPRPWSEHTEDVVGSVVSATAESIYRRYLESVTRRYNGSNGPHVTEGFSGTSYYSAQPLWQRLKEGELHCFRRCHEEGSLEKQSPALALAMALDSDMPPFGQLYTSHCDTIKDTRFQISRDLKVYAVNGLVKKKEGRELFKSIIQYDVGIHLQHRVWYGVQIQREITERVESAGISEDQAKQQILQELIEESENVTADDIVSLLEAEQQSKGYLSIHWRRSDLLWAETLGYAEEGKHATAADVRAASKEHQPPLLWPSTGSTCRSPRCLKRQQSGTPCIHIPHLSYTKPGVRGGQVDPEKKRGIKRREKWARDLQEGKARTKRSQKPCPSCGIPIKLTSKTCRKCRSYARKRPKPSKKPWTALVNFPEAELDAFFKAKIRGEVAKLPRDTKMIAQLKDAYNDTCQMCNNRDRRMTGGAQRKPVGRSVGAHIMPFSEFRELDKPENILILCDKCHGDFDSGLIDVIPQKRFEPMPPGYAEDPAGDWDRYMSRFLIKHYDKDNPIHNTPLYVLPPGHSPYLPKGHNLLPVYFFNRFKWQRDLFAGHPPMARSTVGDLRSAYPSYVGAEDLFDRNPSSFDERMRRVSRQVATGSPEAQKRLLIMRARSGEDIICSFPSCNAAVNIHEDFEYKYCSGCDQIFCTDHYYCTNECEVDKIPMCCTAEISDLEGVGYCHGCDPGGEYSTFVCDRHLIACLLCANGNRYCAGCVVQCPICDSAACEDCFVTCRMCGEGVCTACSDQCAGCGRDPYCNLCLSEDGYCSAEACQHGNTEAWPLSDDYQDWLDE